MKRGLYFLFIELIFVLIIFGNEVSASFEVGNLSHAIDKQYGPGDYVRGWLNISLNDEPTTSAFEDCFGNSINLIELLRANKNIEYSCNTADCGSDYSASNAEETKTFNLRDGETKTIGFKFTEDITDISSVNFVVESDAGQSCSNQLEIDFLDDGLIDIGNNKSLEISCIKSHGCFDNAEDQGYGVISTVPFCQKIHFTASPGFILNAWLKEKIPGQAKLTIGLYDVKTGNSIEGAYCELPKPKNNWEEVSCDIDYLVLEPKDYYVCVYSDGGSGEYLVSGYATQNGCGFHGFPPQEENSANNISVEGKMFNAVGTLEVSNSLGQGNTLGQLVKNYIIKKYRSLDCSDNCVVPIKFISRKNQKITIKDLIIKYNVGSYIKEEKKFYELTEIPSKVNSGFERIYLDKGNFSLPKDYGNASFELYLNNNKIFSENISIENVPIIKYLTPTRTASLFPTLFEIGVESSNNIIKYEWDFNDSNTKITATNKITHAYNSTGEYKLKITITDSNKLSSYKTFNIIVESPKKLISSTIEEMQKDLTNLKAGIGKFDSFYQNGLNQALDVEGLEKELISLQKKYSVASESDYNKIVPELLDLRIPESIIITNTADSISFYPEKDDINLEVLQEIGVGNYDSSDENKYINAILAWNIKNAETKLTFNELSAKYEYLEEPVLKIFKLKVKKNNPDYDPYLILRKLDNLKFKENYLENEKSGYVYIKLTEPEKTIIFSTTEDVDFTDLPFFISPRINSLVLMDDIIKGFDTEEENSKWTVFILILLFLIIIGFVAYIILQEWYKKKYETYLFKNKNSLYNLITYIGNAKKGGLKENEIRTKLKKAGWNSEQIAYVMKKYSGKRTGMFEIPIGKILKKFKKKTAPQGKSMPINEFKAIKIGKF